MQQVISMQSLAFGWPLPQTPYHTSLALFSGRYCRDRFNRLNKWSEVPWVETVDPVPERTDKPISDFMDERACELIKKGSIAVQWSGGVDSTGLTVALMKNGINPQDLVILHDKNSIEEYPEFYEKYSKDWNFQEASDWYKTLGSVDTDVVVNGWCADQLFGSVFFHRVPSAYMEPMETFPKHLTPITNVDKDRANSICEIIKDYGRNLFDIDIRTMADYGWFINFALKWTYVSTFNELYLSKTKNRHKTLVFYDTPGFQSWSLSNFENVSKVNIYDPETPWEYKKPLKEYSYEFTKDEKYLKIKGKHPSWNGGNNSTMYKMGICVVKTTKGYIHYSLRNVIGVDQILQSLQNLE